MRDMSETATLSAADPAPDTEMSPKLRQIVVAAEDLFMAHGYGAVSMDQVARTANVSKATLYAYFTSKDALFASVVRNKGMQTPLRPDMFPDNVTDLRAALEEIGERLIRFMLLERTLAIYRIAVAEAARFPELGIAFYANGPHCMIERFSDWLGVLIAQGLVIETDTLMASEQFIALVRANVFLRRSLSVPPLPTDAELTASVKWAVDTWMKAFETQTPPDAS